MQEVDPFESEPEPVEGDPDPCPEDEGSFVCVEWESQLFRGTYPFNMPKRSFHGFNPKVSVYTFILDIYTSTY